MCTPLPARCIWQVVSGTVVLLQVEPSVWGWLMLQCPVLFQPLRLGATCKAAHADVLLDS